MLSILKKKLLSLSKQHQGILALVLLAWVFATMGLFARQLDTNFALFEQTYLRIALALVLGIILFWPKLRWSVIKSISLKDSGVLFVRSVFLYLAVVLITEAILNTKFSTATIITVLPLMPLLGYIFLREVVRVKTLLWIIVGFIGSVLVAIQSFNSFSFGYGELMALCSILLFDISYITRKWQSKELNNYESTVIMFGFAVPFLFITSLVLGEMLPDVSDFTLSMLAFLLIAALFNVVNLLLTNFGFEHVKAAVAGNILTLEVFFVLLYGFFFYGEVPVLREVIGGLLILSSVFAVNYLENKKPVA